MAKDQEVAVATTQKTEEKKNRLKEAFTKDYKYEGLVLLILAIIAIILGALIITGVLEIPGESDSSNGVFLIGGKPNSTIFAWILIVLGIFSLILSIWPYYKPSIFEVKRVTWPTKKTMLSDCINVFIYSIGLALFFYVADLALNGIFSLISGN